MEWTGEVAALRAWAFEEWYGEPPRLLENVSFLAGYRRRGLGSAARRRGITTEMLRPPAGWLRAVTVARWAVTTERAMDRPRPTPSRMPVRACIRRNGSNSEGTAASRIDGPPVAISM